MHQPRFRIGRTYSHQPGNRRVRLVFGRLVGHPYAEKTIARTPISLFPTISVGFLLCHTCFLSTGDCKLVVTVDLLVFTVRALHEGTLVKYRTTAHIRYPRCWSIPAQLASVLFILATLTIAARCHASNTDANHRHLVQNKPPPRPGPSPIDYSNVRHSSSIVLRKLFPYPNRSDTRITTRSNPVNYKNGIRTKREIHSPVLNHFVNVKSKSSYEENFTSYKDYPDQIDKFNSSHNVSLIQKYNIVSLSNNSLSAGESLSDKVNNPNQTKTYSETQTENEDPVENVRTENRRKDSKQFMQSVLTHSKNSSKCL